MEPQPLCGEERLETREVPLHVKEKLGIGGDR